MWVLTWRWALSQNIHAAGILVWGGGGSSNSLVTVVVSVVWWLVGGRGEV